MDTFLDDQFKQMDRIVNSFKEDISTLDDIVRSWEELPNSKSEELSKIIKSKIKNKTTIEIFIDEQGQYILDLKFEPISIVWALKVDYGKENKI
jgi:hypothetical protein